MRKSQGSRSGHPEVPCKGGVAASLDRSPADQPRLHCAVTGPLASLFPGDVDGKAVRRVCWRGVRSEEHGKGVPRLLEASCPLLISRIFAGPTAATQTPRNGTPVSPHLSFVFNAHSFCCLLGQEMYKKSLRLAKT